MSGNAIEFVPELGAEAQEFGVLGADLHCAGPLSCNLATCSEALKQRLADAGAVEALLQAMAQHRHVAACRRMALGRCGISLPALRP